MKKLICAFFLICLLSNSTISFAVEHSIYNNKEYGFSAAIPSDWKLYDSGNASNPDRWIIDWEPLKVWSKKKQTYIGHSVTITVLKETYNSIDDVIEAELRRVKDILISKTDIISSNNKKSIILMTTINGLLYKSKSLFFLYGKKGYIVTFTATDDTFDVNDRKFEEFIQSLKFDNKLSSSH